MLQNLSYDNYTDIFEYCDTKTVRNILSSAKKYKKIMMPVLKKRHYEKLKVDLWKTISEFCYIKSESITKNIKLPNTINKIKMKFKNLYTVMLKLRKDID
jgi:hypothetical protein